MVTINSTNRSISESSFAQLTQWRGGELGSNPLGGTAGLNVVATPTEFRYAVSDARGHFSATSGTGIDLVYDSNNVPIGGIITSLSTSLAGGGTGAGGPRRFNSVTVSDLNVTVLEALDTNFIASLLAADNSVLIDRENAGYIFGGLIVETGDGNDRIEQNNEGLDFGSSSFLSVNGALSTNTGAGSDKVIWSAEGFNETLVLGAGADTVVQQSYTQLPQNAPSRIISDFNPAEDRIELEPFADGSRVWEIVDFEGNVVVRSVSATNAADIRDTVTLTGLDTSQLALGPDGVVSGLQAPSAAPVFGTEGADVLFGDPNANIINGLGGDDAIITFENDDVLLGGEGNDSLDGGSGNDQLFGENGNDQIFAGGGDDAVFGGFGDDLLIGDADGTTGVDGLFGEDGNDVAYGGLGNDFISGGNGNDVLFGETGNDEILGGEGNDTILGGTDNDQLFGENGDDVIDGGQGVDTIFGGFGNDLIFGGDGNGAAGDGLFGEAGDDVIRGGSGNDFILGGLGNDVISGGAGADIVRLESGSGFDFWQDFENGVDRIDASFIAGGRGQVVIAATLDGTGTYVGFAETQLLLEGVDFNLIDQEDFIFDDVA